MHVCSLAWPFLYKTEYNPACKHASDYAALIGPTRAKIPDLAKRFKSYADAEKAAKRCNQKNNIALLFDIDDQFCVVGSD
jgi:hypothetical protein